MCVQVKHFSAGFGGVIQIVKPASVKSRFIEMARVFCRDVKYGQTYN